MNLSVEDLRAIDDAVACVRDRLQPEDRWDLRQELAIKLMTKRPPDAIKNWLRECAWNWTTNFLRDESRQRTLARELRVNATAIGGRRDDVWSPDWYPPHPSAEPSKWRPNGGRYAPFACEGARVMHCKPGQHRKSEG